MTSDTLLHIVVYSNLARALDDAKREPLVTAIHHARATAETREGRIKYCSATDTDRLRGLRPTSFSIHVLARRNVPPVYLAEIREIMRARQIPETDFLSGLPAPRLIPSHLVGDPRALALAARARELAGDDPFIAYCLLISATAQALLLRDRDQWEGFTDLDLALAQLRENAAARADAPTTL
jgi:hypothetical protein